MKKMKKLAIVTFCLGLFSGCANVNYIAPTTGERFSYTRLGMQKINGFQMTKDDKGLISIEFDKQEGSMGDIAEALKNVSTVMLKTTTPVP